MEERKNELIVSWRDGRGVGRTNGMRDLVLERWYEDCRGGMDC
jgi:hypothetical protein